MGGMGDWMAPIFDSISTNFENDKKFTTDAWFMNENQKWEERQRGSAMQRRVEDLKKAGLNPMLAFGGSGTGIGASGGGSPAGHSSGGGGHSSFSQSSLTAASAAQIRAQTTLIESQRRNIDADTAAKVAQEGHLTASAGAAAASADVSRAELPKIAAQIKEIEAGAYHKTAQGILADWDAAKLKQMLPALVELMNNDATRSRLGLRKAENMSEAEKSWWKKNVAPYLDDAATIGSSASSVLRTVK